ncbi:MAG: hypothetical protein ACLUOF_02665 [Ruminococcus sp.]
MMWTKAPSIQGTDRSVGSTVKVQQGDSLDSDTKTLSSSFTPHEGLTIDRQNEVTNKVKELCPDNE